MGNRNPDEGSKQPRPLVLFFQDFCFSAHVVRKVRRGVGVLRYIWAWLVGGKLIMKLFVDKHLLSKILLRRGFSDSGLVRGVCSVYVATFPESWLSMG